VARGEAGSLLGLVGLEAWRLGVVEVREIEEEIVVHTKRNASGGGSVDSTPG